MENGLKTVNGSMTIEQYIEKASDDAKKMYMERIWRMDKEQIFHELMRVHAESSKLLMQAEAEIKRIRSLLDPDDGDARHWQISPRATSLQDRDDASHSVSKEEGQNSTSSRMESEVFWDDLQRTHSTCTQPFR